MACAACWSDGVAAARDLLRPVWVARVPVATLGMGAAALLLPEQMRDLMAGVGESAAEGAAFLVAFAIWSLLLWFSGRWSITLRYGVLGKAEEHDREERYAKWLPRALLVGPIAVALVAIWRARAGLAADGVLVLATYCVLVVLVGGGVALFAWWRGELAERSPRLAFLAGDRRGQGEDAPDTGGKADNAKDDVHSPLRRARAGLRADFARAPFGAAATLVVVALPCIGIALLAIALATGDWPLAVAAWLGAPALILLWLALATPFFTFLAMQVQNRLGLPGLATVFVLGALSGNWTSNHDIRRLAAKPDPPRPNFDTAASAWLDACRPDGPDAAAPVLIIASAGGGSRAALWTGVVLSELDARLGGRLHRHLFALSGVSGGSLGLAGWSSAMADAEVDCTQAQARPAPANMLAFLGGNYLAAPVGGYLSLDLAQRYFVPFNLFVSLPDRAELLERSWERSWREAYPLSNRLAQPFTTLRDGVGARPIVVLNGTSRDTGRRVVTATVELTTAGEREAPVLPEALDAITMLGRDVRISTAVGNSARFPFITPTGRLNGPVPGSSAANGGERPQDHIVDGGYYENSGMETALLLAQALRRVHAARAERAARRPHQTLPIMLLQIQSDPDKTEAELYRCGRPAQVPLQLNSSGVPQVMDDFLGPGIAIAGTYGAHTRAAIARAAALFCGADAFFHVALCDDPRQQEPPIARIVQLSWMLTARARRYLMEDAPRRCGNMQEIDRLVGVLAGTSLAGR